MSHQNNNTINFTDAPYKSSDYIADVDRELKMGELRLRYVQLMRDFHTFFGEEDATNLIKQSVDIWEKLKVQKTS